MNAIHRAVRSVTPSAKSATYIALSVVTGVGRDLAVGVRDADLLYIRLLILVLNAAVIWPYEAWAERRMGPAEKRTGWQHFVALLVLLPLWVAPTAGAFLLLGKPAGMIATAVGIDCLGACGIWLCDRFSLIEKGRRGIALVRELARRR